MIFITDIALVIFVLSCIISLSSYMYAKVKDGANRKINVKRNSYFNQIVGESKTKVGQGSALKESSPKSKENKRLLIPPEDMERVFYTKEEAQLDIDVDIEGVSSMDVLQNEEDLYLFEGIEPSLDLASGAEFEELSEMSMSIQSNLSELSDPNIINACQTIETVENTDLFGQLISQVENGEQKVADVLDRCEAELKEPSQLPLIKKGWKDLIWGCICEISITKNL